MSAESSVVAEKIIAPYVAYKLFPGQRNIAVTEKIKEKVVFLRGHVRANAVHVNECFFKCFHSVLLSLFYRRFRGADPSVDALLKRDGIIK